VYRAGQTTCDIAYPRRATPHPEDERGEAHDPSDELRYALAGPAVTAVIAACFGVALLALPSSTPPVIRALIEYQVLINGLILIFNLLPAFPLDGGRVLRSLLWRRSGDIGRSTETAAGVGRGFGFERPAFAKVGRAVVIDELGRPVGLVSITDVKRSLRASRLADRPAGGGGVHATVG